MSELRAPDRRKSDVLEVLGQNPSCFLATASGGRPHVIAISPVWDGDRFVFATRGPSRTARNLADSRAAKLAIGSPDDVILVDVEVASSVPVAGAPAEIAGTFVSGAGWDPADEGDDWVYFELRPRRIQAYRGYGELEGRDVMRDGRWLA